MLRLLLARTSAAEVGEGGVPDRGRRGRRRRRPGRQFRRCIGVTAAISRRSWACPTACVAVKLSCQACTDGVLQAVSARWVVVECPDV
jgi:hypothetical protein